MATITTPIWKDCYVTLATATSIPFRVRANSTLGDIIYTGLCSARPGETDCVVRINDIAADYLTHTVPTLGTAAFSALSFPVKFYIETWDGAQWNFLTDDYAFVMDWSYDPGRSLTAGDILSEPIVPVLHPSQYVLLTAYDVAAITAVFGWSDGYTHTETISLVISADFNIDYNHDFARSLRSSGSGTAAFKLSDYLHNSQIADTVTVNGVTFTVDKTSCARYVLYYLNAFGGWDSLLCTGTPNRSDGIERNTNEMEYDNRGVQNRGRKDYALDITRRHTFRTGLLDDNAAGNMWHLLESTDVYVHDLESGIPPEVRPLVLTGSECVYKSFKSNGGRMPQYDIEAEVAQVFERR